MSDSVKMTLAIFERRIWELEQAMMQTNPQALKEAREGIIVPRMPDDPKDGGTPPQQPIPGQQTPQAPQVPGDNQP